MSTEFFKELKVKDVAGGFSKKRLKHDTAVGIADKIPPGCSGGRSDAKPGYRLNYLWGKRAVCQG